ncbi:MAG: TonB-dependent receptor [Acidobacteria bacterium]|nr:TonB-dependent receptor [Acidobacteriota bacterium]MBI3655707.1 TonB-dependent receptor [Acidobacteriota bacterium]
MRNVTVYKLVVCFLFLCLTVTGLSKPRDTASVSGTVRDTSGGTVANAEVALQNAQQAIIGTAKADNQGHFTLAKIPSGSYLLVITSPGFAEKRMAINVQPMNAGNLEVTLELQTISDQVTVTANLGQVEDKDTIAQQVNVINEQAIAARAKSVTAQVANEEVGVLLQRTSPSISGIFIRGLTGNKVNVFIDGVRYSTSAMRGGISTFLNLLDASNLQAVEILRGPNSAQYGSDALGGSIQFLERVATFSTGGATLHGKWGTFFNSADAGFGSNVAASYAMRNFGVLANFTGHRVNTLRTGQGIDSHAAVTRFLGLPSDVIGKTRLPDTGFSQYGGLLKMNWSPAPGSQIIAHYARSQQDGAKRYDQLLGGDGNLIADLRNFMLDLFYIRFDQLKLGWLDNLSVVYSFNAQREERVNQGGNGNPRAAITHEPERTGAHGAQAFASKNWGLRNGVVLGGEYYHERVNSPSYSFNPVAGAVALRRGRVPDNALYQSGGVYLQDIVNVIPGKLRVMGNLRYSAASYASRALDSPIIGGKRLWPDDSLRANSVTFRAGAVFTPVEGFSLLASLSRGFRAPHISDLGTLGLTGNGFEVAAPDVAGLGATVGSTADRNAISTGRLVTQVKPETSLTYDFGTRYRNRQVDTDFTFFVNNLHDNITKQALILPIGAIGRSLGDQTIVSQNPNGTVFVAAATSPVLVRTNYDNARLYGFEHTLDVKVRNCWTIGSLWTYLHARDARTGLPPNIEGGTPAANGYLKIRYSPARQFWVEPYVHLAARQDRLSSLDLEDRRVGATRARGQISNFFLNGAGARGLIGPGGVLLATGETLAQVQNRVLGVGVASAPLFTAIPGYITFNVRGGIRLGERHEVLVDLENLGDRNYRGISWGLDAPGRSLYVRYNTRF